MNNLDDRKPTRMPVRGVINSGSLAYKYLLNYDKELLEKPKPIDIIDFISNYLHLSVINATMSHPIVEAFIIYSIGNFKDYESKEIISITPGTIIINKEIQNDVYKRYVLAHEAAHWINYRERPSSINSKYYSCCKNFVERSDLFNKEKFLSYYEREPDADLELFADGTANAITMPATTFLPLASKLMEEYGFSDNRIIEASKKNETAEIIRKLATTYNVPEFAVKNHLYNFGMFMINENDIL